MVKQAKTLLIILLIWIKGEVNASERGGIFFIYFFFIFDLCVGGKACAIWRTVSIHNCT